MIIYFTGTGNSRYIARAIADGLEDEVVCANTYIRENRPGDFTSVKPYVFVFPVYLSIIPAIFREFLLSSKFHGNHKAYFVPTCASADGSVPNAAIDLCRASGFFEYMGSYKIRMPQNYILLFRMFSQEEIDACREDAKIPVKKVCRAVRRGIRFPEMPASRVEYLGTRLVEKWYYARFTRTYPFHATDACIGCGLCARSCPMNIIEMVDGRPQWKHTTCTHCTACINRCPKQAIEYGKKTKGKPRYVCKD